MEQLSLASFLLETVISMTVCYDEVQIYPQGLSSKMREILPASKIFNTSRRQVGGVCQFLSL